MKAMHNKNLLSIGQTLKETRESKKIPLKKIADRTRINISILQAIEEGQVSAFPVHAYLRGFILAYVKALDLDEKEWATALKSLSPTEENEHLSEVAGTGGPASALIEKDMRLTPVILATLILFILGSILVLANVLTSYKEKKPAPSQIDLPIEPPEEKKPANQPVDRPEGEEKTSLPAEKPPAKGPLLKIEAKKPAEEEPSQPKDKPALAPASSVDSAPSSTAPANKEEELEIIVKALEEVRVHYQVDQGEKQSSLLAEDQFKVLKGKKNIFIKTKRSDLIYIFHNGKDLGLFGSGGKKEQSFSLTETSERKEQE